MQPPPPKTPAGTVPPAPTRGGAPLSPAGATPGPTSPTRPEARPPLVRTDSTAVGGVTLPKCALEIVEAAGGLWPLKAPKERVDVIFPDFYNDTDDETAALLALAGPTRVVYVLGLDQTLDAARQEARMRGLAAMCPAGKTFHVIQYNEEVQSRGYLWGTEMSTGADSMREEMEEWDPEHPVLCFGEHWELEGKRVFHFHSSAKGDPVRIMRFLAMLRIGNCTKIIQGGAADFNNKQSTGFCADDPVGTGLFGMLGVLGGPPPIGLSTSATAVEFFAGSDPGAFARMLEGPLRGSELCDAFAQYHTMKNINVVDAPFAPGLLVKPAAAQNPNLPDLAELAQDPVGTIIAVAGKGGDPVFGTNAVQGAKYLKRYAPETYPAIVEAARANAGAYVAKMFAAGWVGPKMSAERGLDGKAPLTDAELRGYFTECAAVKIAHCAHVVTDTAGEESVAGAVCATLAAWCADASMDISAPCHFKNVGGAITNGTMTVPVDVLKMIAYAKDETLSGPLYDAVAFIVGGVVAEHGYNTAVLAHLLARLYANGGAALVDEIVETLQRCAAPGGGAESAEAM